MKRRWPGFAVLGWALLLTARAAEVLPPPPANHFNDYAGLVGAGTAAQLEAELVDYERATSNQILVAIFPKMPSDSSVEDYTVRVAQSWHAGAKGRDNGAVLFIFVASHQIYIQVGYGLEGALTDARCRQIISNVITPAFRQQQFNRGVTAGVDALLAAAQGEYHGTGATARDGRRRANLPPYIPIAVFVLVLLITFFRRRYYVYSPGGFTSGGWGGGWGGGGDGGGGSFSGGGGNFGGGGAGGSW